MEVPRHWRLKKQRYALVGEICPRCATVLFPPRAVCPVCAEQAKDAQAVAQPQPMLALHEHMQSTGR